MHELSMRKTLSYISLPCFCLVSALMLVCYYFRLNINPIYANINFMFYISYFWIIGTKIKVSISDAVLWIIIVIQAFFINVKSGLSIVSTMYSITLYYFPLLLLIIKNKFSYKKKKQVVTDIIRVINFFVILIFLIYLIDIVTKSSIMRFLTSTILPQMASWIPKGESLLSNRYASYLGHYLFTAETYMVFFFLNLIYSKVFNTELLKMRYVYIIAVVGVLSTASKTAIVILAISLVWINIKGERRIRNIIVLTIAILFLYRLGMFDLIVSRFQDELLTTGRNEVWSVILSKVLSKPHVFTGYGEMLNGLLVNEIGTYNAGIALEYPFLVLLYKYGVFNVAIMVWFLIGKVMKAALVNKNWFIVLAVIAIFLEINAFNAYLVLTDASLFFVLFIFLLSLINECTEEMK